MNMDLSTISSILNKELPRLQSEFNLESLGLFGSFVRNEPRSGSDLDILVTFSEAPTLIQFVHLKNHLSDLLGIKVDLVMKKALKPRISEKILKEVVSISWHKTGIS